MVKYSPKENSYREMYLINKFEKDVMENSLKNLRNNKKDLIDKSVTTNNENPEGRKEAIENNDDKILQLFPSNTTHEGNEINPANNPEVSNLSIENEMPLNSTKINDDSNLAKKVDPSKSKNDPSISSSSFQSALGTDKTPNKKTKKPSRNEKKQNSPRSGKLSESRVTRNMAKSNRKAKRRIIVKNADKTISITPWKKRKKENANESSDEFFHGWKL